MTGLSDAATQSPEVPAWSLGPAASGLAGNWLQMHALGPHHRRAYSRTLDLGSGSLVLANQAGDTHATFKNPCLRILL